MLHKRINRFLALKHETVIKLDELLVVDLTLFSRISFLYKRESLFASKLLHGKSQLRTGKANCRPITHHTRNFSATRYREQ